MSSSQRASTVQRICDSFPPELRMLLPVLTGDAATSIAAWEAWQSRYTVADAGWATKRQFSRVYATLRRHGAQPVLLEEVAVHFQLNEKKVQRFLSELNAVWPLLSRVAVPSILLKSVSLIALGYEEVGSRTMYDLDILVPYESADLVFGELVAAGWTFLHAHVHSIEDKRYEHGVDLKSANGGRLDLHWNLMLECLEADQDAPYWQRARTAELSGTSVSVLDPTDLFFHICIHGFQRIDRRFDWAIDIHRLLQHEAAAIEWPRLLRQATERSVVHRLQISIGFLREACGISFPPEFLNALDDAELTLPDKLELYMEMRGMNTWVGNFPTRLAAYLRQGGRRSPLHFLRFMQYHWGTKTLGETLLRLSKVGLAIQKRR